LFAGVVNMFQPVAAFAAGDHEEPHRPATETAPAAIAPDRYRPIARAELTPDQRFQLELAACAPDSEARGEDLHVDSFGERYLRNYGWQPGRPLQQGGRDTPYAPRSVGGFASSTKTQHDVRSISVGDIVVAIDRRASAEAVSAAPSAAALPAATAPPRVMLVAEDDADDADAGQAQVLALRVALARNAGTVIQCDAKQVKFTVCGTGASRLASRAELRAATALELLQVRAILAERAGRVGVVRARDEPTGTVPVQATPSCDAQPSWIQQNVLVTLASPDGGDDDAAADEGQPVTVMRVLSGARACLSSGDTVPIGRLRPVAPLAGRKAVVVRTESGHAGPVGLRIGDVVTVTDAAQARANGRVAVRFSDGTQAHLPVEWLSALAR